MRGCCTDDANRKLEVLALSDSKMKGRSKCVFRVVSGMSMGMDERWVRQDAVLILSALFARSVTEWK